MLVDCQCDIDQCRQGSSEVRIGDFVSGLSPLRFGDDDSASTQACQVIRHVRPGQVQVAGQLRRIARLVQEREQNPRPSAIGHRSTQAVHDVDTRGYGQHIMTIHQELT